MKKTKLAVLLITPLLLVGCDKLSNKSSFKENLSYERELEVAEKATVLAEVQNKLFIECKKAVKEETETTKTSHSEHKVTEKTTADFYNDLYFSVVTEKTDYQKVDGVALTEKTKEHTEIYDAPALLSVVTYSEKEDRKGATYSRNIYSEETAETTRSAFHNYYFNQIVDMDLSGLTGYLAKGGKYAFVYSSISETRTPVAWGEGTKEYVSISKAQAIVEIDKDYKVTNVSMYSEVTANRDPDTQEWYSKEKAILTATAKAAFSYGTLSAAPSDKYQEAVDRVSGNYMPSGNITVEYGKYDSDARTFTPSSTVSASSSSKTTLSFSHFNIQATYLLPVGTDSVNAFRITAFGTIYDQWSSSSAVVKEKNIVLNGLAMGTTTTEKIVNIIPKGRKLRIVLDYDCYPSVGDLVVDVRTEGVYDA